MLFERSGKRRAKKEERREKIHTLHSYVFILAISVLVCECANCSSSNCSSNICQFNFSHRKSRQTYRCVPTTIGSLLLFHLLLFCCIFSLFLYSRMNILLHTPSARHFVFVIHNSFFLKSEN